MKEENIIKVLSLFSGCGGLDLGFEGNFLVLDKSINKNIFNGVLINHEEEKINDGWFLLPSTGFKNIFANDILPYARTAWTNYFGKRGNSEKDFYLNSIVDLVKKAEQGNSIFPEGDIITGGFPCQDFSVAGKRLGFNSTKSHHGKQLNVYDNPSEENRGKLYFWMKKVIELVNPKMFIAENVKGLISLHDVRNIIESDFRNVGKEGFLVFSKVLRAYEYGVPQTRERIFFIGINKEFLRNEIKKDIDKFFKEILYPFPEITHGNTKKDKNLYPFVNSGDAFFGLDEPDNTKDLSQRYYSRAKWYGKHCQGQSEISLNSLGPTIRAEHHGNIEFRRLSLEHRGKNMLELHEGYKERRLSVRECARLQTFPDDFEFIIKPSKNSYGVSMSDAYRLIGNAVPPLLAFQLAWRIKRIWNVLFD